ncbi:MAG: cold shock protein [Micromonosporaceae bacterium]|jgi:cold shock CspA family protein|nr:cold shock protein [Micromonosporaceae bacterium]
MASGRIIQFNNAKGYGFISSDDGGEDVFLHSAELPDHGFGTRVGTRLEFNVLSGQRGLKACDVRVLEPTVAVASAPAPAPHHALPHRTASNYGDDELSDVIDSAEYAREITEALIDVVPSITASQIVEARQRLMKAAYGRGWLDE